MNHRLLIAFAALGVLAVASSAAFAHCQVPCGIYDDPARFGQLEEHVTTLEKSMKQIEELSKEAKPNYNQIVRWVNNKEDHADKLSEIVTYYFMAQRIKPPVAGADRAAVAKYFKELSLLHQMLVEAMKAKQTTDLEHCGKLRALIGEFRGSYLGNAGKKTAAAHQHGEHGHTH